MIGHRVVNLFKHKEVINVVDKLDYLGNYKCHQNSLNYALKHPNKVESIIGGIQVFKNGDSVAHFIVKMKDGTYRDPSYGRLSSVNYSYLIPIEEYSIRGFSPNRELRNLKEYLFSKLPWYVRLFSSPNSI